MMAPTQKIKEARAMDQRRPYCAVKGQTKKQEKKAGLLAFRQLSVRNAKYLQLAISCSSWS